MYSYGVYKFSPWAFLLIKMLFQFLVRQMIISGYLRLGVRQPTRFLALGSVFAPRLVMHTPACEQDEMFVRGTGRSSEPIDTNPLFDTNSEIHAFETIADQLLQHTHFQDLLWQQGFTS